MATQYAPIAKDSSINTTEQTPRNVADVLAQGLDENSRIKKKIINRKLTLTESLQAGLLRTELLSNRVEAAMASSAPEK